MRILINLQPMTVEEMPHFNAFSCVSVGSTSRLFRLLHDANLLEPRYFKESEPLSKAFWGIFEHHHRKGIVFDKELPGVFTGGGIVLPGGKV
ncbi:MAG: hypothetical protein LBB72_01555 [Spirochaetaceae bacterium]|jgi:hypothetical protein|nr:hypothetical protein [Spirochaetaceae bacterium]